MKNLLFFTLLVIYCEGVRAQKSARGSEAFQDGKYDKAAELFESALLKDSNDLVAQVGFARATLKRHEQSNTAQAMFVYTFSIKNLNKAIASFPNADVKEHKLLYKLGTIDITEVEALRRSISLILWTDYYNKNRNADSLQIFYDKFCYGATLKEICYERLATLYFDNIKNSNSIADFKEFLTRFEKYTEAKLAKKAIERLQVDEALSSSSTELLRYALSQYPSNPKQADLKAKLAEVYYGDISADSDREKIKAVKDSLSLLSSPRASELIDSCRYFLFKLDYKDLIAADRKELLKSCLDNFSQFDYLDEYQELQNRKNDLIFQEQSSPENPINYHDIQEFITETPASYAGLDKLLSKIALDLNEHCKKRFENDIDQFISNKGLCASYYKLSLAKLIRSFFPSEFTISSNELYNAILVTDAYLDENSYISSLIRRLKVADSLDRHQLKVKAITADGSLISIRFIHPTNGLNKRQYVINSDNLAYQEVPKLPTTAPIYEAISREIGIVRYSNPELINVSGVDRFDMQVYGYLPNDQTCCPSKRLTIVYALDSNLSSFPKKNADFPKPIIEKDYFKSLIVRTLKKKPEDFFENPDEIEEIDYMPIEISLQSNDDNR